MSEELVYSLVPISEIKVDEWNKFISSVPEATFFCTTDYWKSYKDSYFLQVRNADGTIISGIPFCIQSEVPIIGSFFRFCRLESSVLVSTELDSHQIYKLKKLNFQYLIGHLSKNKVVFLFISSKSRSNDAAILNELGFDLEKGATFIIDLTNDEKNIYKMFSKGHKAAIQNAQKAGVRIEILDGKKAFEHLHDYCSLQDKLVMRKGRNFSTIYFKSEAFLTSILSSDSYRAYLAMAWFREQPAAGAILITFNKVLYYYLGATDYSVTNKVQASNLLQYEIIRFGKKSGFEIYDFGGVPVNPVPTINTYGVYKFKKSFGGKHCQYDTGIYVMKKHRYKIMRKMIKYEHNFFIQSFYNFLRKS